MKQKLPLNPRKEIFRWGPAPGRLFYMSEFIDAIYHVFPKKFPGFSWPKTLALFQDGRMLWVNEFPAIRKAGKNVFLAYMLPEKSRARLRRKWRHVAAKLRKFEKNLSCSKLLKLSDNNLHQLGKRFYSLLINFWILTVPMELGNYGSDHLLDVKLRKYVPDELQRQRVMEILTAPEELSFYQKEEIALQKTKNLEGHWQKYYWLHNSYNGTKILPLSFFIKRKKQLSHGLFGKSRVLPAQVKKNKIEIKRKYCLPKEIMNIASALSYGVAWQDERKEQIFIYLHYKDLILKELARRKNMQFSDLQNFTTSEVINLAKKSFGENLPKRKGKFGFFCRVDKIVELDALSVSKYWKLYGEQKIGTKTQLIKGIIASRGFAKGKVKIVKDPFMAPNFNKGDILASPMTTPEYVFLMKKSSAIITDTGGLTSHAAIVSRELGVPCIVNTKIATQVLRDGDLVEVDADRGVVNIIKRGKI